jgi:hypothetical protein
VWFTEPSGNRIGRVNPMSGLVTETGVGINYNVFGITAGTDGNLWFSEYSNDRVGRITPLGAVTEFSAGISNASHPLGLVAGPDGNVWFAEDMGSRIARITPTGVVTEYSAGITTGSRPRYLAVGPDGNIWFTEATGNAIGRLTLDPSATTGAAGQVGTSAATLSGIVTPFGAQTSYAFEYGTTTGYGSATASKLLNPSTQASAVSADATGLKPATLYHYRVVATSSAGTTRGADRTFTTPTSGSAGGSGGSSDRLGPKLAVLGRRLTLSAKGVVAISLRCPVSETLGCHRTVTIRTAKKVAAQAAARKLRLGSAKFRIAGGKTKTVKVRLGASARAVVRRLHKLSVTLTVTGLDSSNNRRVTAKRLTLRG